MATYRVTAPDGSQWDVNAPDDAKEDAVMRYAKAQWGHQSKKPDYKPVSPTEGMSAWELGKAGAGKAGYDIARGIGQMLGMIPQSEIDDAKKMDAPLMNTGAGMAGNIGANMLTAFIPGGNTVKGAALVGAGLSALQPTATGEDRLHNTMVGGALGAGGALAAKGIGALQGMASNRVASIAEKVQAKAAADAAAETASARSYAGNAAQNAYKQMQVLASKAEQGALSPEESAVWKALQEEYLRKAQEKLIPAATAKEISAQAFKDAIETEAERAASMAANKLSGAEIKSQVMARLKRYGPGALGGAIGGMLIPGIGGAVGGAATGLVLRPAVRSIKNLAQNPAVQYNALKPIATSGLLGDLADPRILGLLGPSIYAAQE